MPVHRPQRPLVPLLRHAPRPDRDHRLHRQQRPRLETVVRVGPLPAIEAGRPLLLPTRWGGFALREASGHLATSASRAVLRMDVEWEVRAADPTDRIAMGDGRKLVWDALAEAGVPAPLRPAWPVVADGSAVAWVPLVRRAPDPRPLDGGYLLVDVLEEPW